MLKGCTVIILCGFVFLSFGCTKKEEGRKVVVQINAYYMSEEDLRQDLKALSIYRPDAVNDFSGRMELLNDLIEKEILLQEAQSLNLDKEERFRRTIENYWKQTLLKTLIEKKSGEISDSVYVYDNEITDYYNKLKSKDPEIKPLLDIKSRLRRFLRREKETELMRAWINDLKEKAYISINKETLKNIALD
ncbi:MAG: hypothetical protein KAU12_01695 [Candidatus Omnitrophica bacterium]|nr:hypothetical protein [Candidatus Omnitrophota bacterium]